MYYDVFLLEIGLYSNVFTLDYDKARFLATNGIWLKNLWQLLHQVGVTLEVDDELEIEGVREGDEAIMAVFMCMKFSKDQLICLNVVRKFKGFLHVSDLMCCDGATLTEYASSKDGVSSDEHIFSHERPTRTDILLWSDAIRSAFESPSSTHTLDNYLRDSYRHIEWFSVAETERAAACPT